MTYTITAYDMDQDEVLYSTDDLEDAQANYAALVAAYEAGDHGYDMDDLEDGVTLCLEAGEDNVLAESTYYA